MLRADSRAFQFYVPKGNLVLEIIVLVTYEEVLLFAGYAICSFTARYAATLFLRDG